VRIAGTARGVKAETVVARRYHVDCEASSAKLGKRLRSIFPAGVISDPTGSSSRSTKTIGARERMRTSAARASACGRTSFETSLNMRKTASTTTGAGTSTSSSETVKRLRA
jgi:hypothetical protein